MVKGNYVQLDTSSSKSLLVTELKQWAAVSTCLGVMRTPPQKACTLRLLLDCQTREAMKGNCPSLASCPPKTYSTLPSSPQSPSSLTGSIFLTLIWFASTTGLSKVAQSGQHVNDLHVVCASPPHIGGAVPRQLCSSWHVPSSPLRVVQLLPTPSSLGQQTPFVPLSHTRSFSSCSASLYSPVPLIIFLQRLFCWRKSGQLSCRTHFSSGSHFSQEERNRNGRLRRIQIISLLCCLLLFHLDFTVWSANTLTLVSESGGVRSEAKQGVHGFFIQFFVSSTWVDRVLRWTCKINFTILANFEWKPFNS